MSRQRLVDATPGKNKLISIIQAAGWPIWPLLLCSVVAMALVIERLVSLRPRRIVPPSLLDTKFGFEELRLSTRGLRFAAVMKPGPDTVESAARTE